MHPQIAPGKRHIKPRSAWAVPPDNMIAIAHRRRAPRNNLIAFHFNIALRAAFFIMPRRSQSAIARLGIPPRLSSHYGGII